MSSEFVVQLNSDKKLCVEVESENRISFNGKFFDVELSKVNNHCFLLRAGSKVYDVTLTRWDNGTLGFLIAGNYFEANVKTKLQEKADEFLKNKVKSSHHDIIKAPMPGLVLQIFKEVGDRVEFGEPLLILEAMKMENSIKSTATGTISEIYINQGSSVEKGAKLLKIE
ncbi:MAG: hypothetical protein KKD86_13370 [Bacteroidetes bacterium]|nr:hypothetical protein [Bacteroidota bacterium]MBU1679817.1 hypothetical protein [Bacteroidota bacterium]